MNKHRRWVIGALGICGLSGVAAGHECVANESSRSTEDGDLQQKVMHQILQRLRDQRPVVELRQSAGARAEAFAHWLRQFLGKEGIVLSALSVKHGVPISDGTPGGHVHAVEYVMEPKPSFSIVVGEEQDGSVFVGLREPRNDWSASADRWIWSAHGLPRE